MIQAGSKSKKAPDVDLDAGTVSDDGSIPLRQKSDHICMSCPRQIRRSHGVKIQIFPGSLGFFLLSQGPSLPNRVADVTLAANIRPVLIHTTLQNRIYRW